MWPQGNRHNSSSDCPGRGHFSPCLSATKLTWLEIATISSEYKNMNKNISLIAAVAAVAFSALIGVVFGSYPAAKASRMTPIDALQRR